MLFKFKPACREKMIVRESPASMVVIEHECCLDRDHPGMHCTKQGHKWATWKKVQRHIEEFGRSL
jgi:hypothetical protein